MPDYQTNLIYDGIREYRANEEERDALLGAAQSKLKMFARDPGFLDTFGEQAAKLPSMSTGALKGFVAGLAGYEHKQDMDMKRRVQEAQLKQYADMERHRAAADARAERDQIYQEQQRAARPQFLSAFAKMSRSPYAERLGGMVDFNNPDQPMSLGRFSTASLLPQETVPARFDGMLHPARFESMEPRPVGLARLAGAAGALGYDPSAADLKGLVTEPKPLDELAWFRARTDWQNAETNKKYADAREKQGGPAAPANKPVPRTELNAAIKDVETQLKSLDTQAARVARVGNRAEGERVAALKQRLAQLYAERDARNGLSGNAPVAPTSGGQSNVTKEQYDRLNKGDTYWFNGKQYTKK